MKQYTISELAKLAGVTTTTVYRKCSTVFNMYHKVLNGKHILEFPDDFDPVALLKAGKMLNCSTDNVQQGSTDVQQGVEAASTPAELAELRGKVERLSADNRELQAQLDGLKGILAEKEKRIASLEQDKAYLQGQYQQQCELLNRLTLPAPRKSWGERVKEKLGIRPKDQ